MFDIENWLPFLLAKSHQVSFNLMKPVVEEYGLTPPQFATLAHLWKGDGINQQELGALMCVDRTTIGGIIDRLEKLGFVHRMEAPEDRRSYILHVTGRGQKVREELLEALTEVKKELGKRLNQEEQEQLVNLLKKLRQCQEI